MSGQRLLHRSGQLADVAKQANLRCQHRPDCTSQGLHLASTLERAFMSYRVLLLLVVQTSATYKPLLFALYMTLPGDI